ncbi:PUA domain-containing protein, partial [Bacillus spizizenii]|uniref:PUA domain-containing protein n=1 Tax=Bacillus spizizenii TaxID=96241 RepID=UPI0028BD562F
DLLDGRGVGTYIGDKEISSVINTRQWIQFHSPIAGEFLIDAGAEEAMIHNGSSLLPAGVGGVIGSFPKGAVVVVRGRGGV